MSTGSQTVFSASGLEIKSYELMQMIHKVEKLEKPDIVPISGSLPPGVHPEIYRKIIEIAKNKEAKVILYTDGDALKVGIQGLPDIIKPNVYELSHLVGVELKGKDEIINAARDIREQGIGIVLTRLNGS